MNSALVEGIRPPARPRAKRPRQLSVEPSGGTWLWATPPCEWTAGPWSWCRAVRGRGRARARARRRGRGRSAWAAAACRAARRFRTSARSIQPPSPAIVTAAIAGAARTTTSGARRPCAPDHERGDDEDPQRVRHRDRQAQPNRVDRRSARPDEVRRHQGLAVAGRQGVARAEGERGRDREEQDERGEVALAEDRRHVAAADPARDGARARHRGRQPAPRPRPARRARASPPGRSPTSRRARPTGRRAAG